MSRITDSQIKFKVEIQGSTYTYHDIPFLDKTRLLFKRMVNGKIPNENVLELGYEFMEAMLENWEGVEDANDNLVSFDKGKIRSLDFKTVLEFADRVVMKELEEFKDTEQNLLSRAAETQEELKNSGSMSGS